MPMRPEVLKVVVVGIDKWFLRDETCMKSTILERAALEGTLMCLACGQPAWAGSSTYGWFCREHYQQETDN